MPVVLVMAITGAIYLLQPQIENLAYKDLLYLEENIQKNPDAATLWYFSISDMDGRKDFKENSIIFYSKASKRNQL